MAAGSVMAFHGSRWHAGGPSTTADRWRLGVNGQYCAGWIRTRQNPHVGMAERAYAYERCRG